MDRAGEEVRPAQPAMHAEGTAKVSGPRGQPTAIGPRTAPSPGDRLALNDLPGSEEHRLGFVSRTADHVHAVVDTVDPVHVQVARWPPHRLVAGRSATRGVRGQVFRAEVGLGFDQADRHPTVRRVMDEDGAQQGARNLERRAIEPATIGRRGQEVRNGAMSSGTNGLRTKPTIGSSHSRNQLRMNDSFMMS